MDETAYVVYRSGKLEEWPVVKRTPKTITIDHGDYGTTRIHLHGSWDRTIYFDKKLARSAAREILVNRLNKAQMALEKFDRDC